MKVSSYDYLIDDFMYAKSAVAVQRLLEFHLGGRDNQIAELKEVVCQHLFVATHDIQMTLTGRAGPGGLPLEATSSVVKRDTDTVEELREFYRERKK